MFVSFLLPKIDRGAGPLYHWVMLAQMSRFRPDEVAFLGDEQYFDEAVVPFGETLQISGLSFRCPDREQFASYKKIRLDSKRLNDLYRGDLNHLDVFREVLCNPQQVLVECINDGLAELDKEGSPGVEAFLTWCNCPSLNQVARARGIPVIHNELGPLRPPLYHGTVYFDFDGVNGNTSASRWTDTQWLNEQLGGAALMEPGELRGLLVSDVPRAQAVSRAKDRYALGLALQVQDDSNCIAFNRGWDELRLIYDAITKHPPAQVLVRPHPHARFVYHGGLGVIDDSADSLAFLGKIDRLIAINSSMLAEAALWGVPFEAKGDGPAVCLGEGGPGGTDVSTVDRTAWLNAFFLSYLVPAEALFDRDYYRWRLAAPRSLGECHQRHMQYLDASGQASLPSLGSPASEGSSRHGPVRMPAAWTRKTSLEARVIDAEGQLDQLRGQLRQADARYKQLEQSYLQRGEQCTGLEQRLAGVRDWQAEAERVWDEHEWMRGRVGELERSLGHSQGEREAVGQERDRLVAELRQLMLLRDELNQQQIAADQRRLDAERELLELRHKLSESESQLDALNKGLRDMRLSVFGRLYGGAAGLPKGRGSH